MSDEPLTPGESNRARPPIRQTRTFAALVITITAVVAMTASAALAWSLRRWRETVDSHAGVAPRATVAPPSDRRSDLLDTGRLAYQVHCARCHGAEGHGDGSDAERLQTPPRDLAAGGWRSAPNPDSIRRTIVTGIPGTAMPGWGESLSRRELDGLVAHVLAIAAVPRRETEGTGKDGSSSSTLATLLNRAGFVAEATPRPAPPLALRDLDGHASTPAGRFGRTTLILFWGTTCGPCLSEIPAVVGFADRHRDRGLELLPICIDETDADIVREAAGPRLASRPIYLDPDGTARLQYDVQTLPTCILIDRTGRILARAQGARDWADPALDDLMRQELTPSL